jgi:hypothetical protein
MRRFSVPVLVPFPIAHSIFFNAEPPRQKNRGKQRTQRIAEEEAIDSAVLRELRVSALRTIKPKTQYSFLGVALVLLLALFSVSGAQTRESLFPGIKGWKLTIEETVYTPNTLWDVIDGAADLFLEYNFVDLHIARYQKSADLEIKVELYRHKSGVDAFGMYSQERYPDYHFIDLGTQGYVEKGTVNFLCGEYYIKISTIQSEQAAQAGLMTIGKELEKRLKRTKSWPSLIAAFPTKGKQANMEQYVARNFLGYSFFNSVFTASYNDGAAVKAFIIRLESPDEASKTIDAYLATLPKEGKSKTEGGRFRVRDPHNGVITFILDQNKICGVLGAEDKTSEALLTELGRRLAGVQ